MVALQSGGSRGLQAPDFVRRKPEGLQAGKKPNKLDPVYGCGSIPGRGFRAPTVRSFTV